MTTTTLALVLASAVIHATWNLWIKQIGPTTKSAPLMWALTGISSLIFGPLVIVIVARGAWRPESMTWMWIVGSAVIHVVYFLLLLRGYRTADLSLVYPVARGTGPLLAMLGAIVILGERPTALSVTGAVCIVTGVLVLTWRSPLSNEVRLAPGIRYGLATGVLIAVYTLWDGWAVKREHIPPLVFYWAGEVVRLVLFTPTALANRDDLRTLWATHRLRVVGIAALSPLSYILILIALRDGSVSHIAPAREISILIGAYLGGRVLGEGERSRRLVAGVAFVAGILALAWA